MDRMYWFAILLGVAAGCGTADAKPDSERVQGTWQIVSGSDGGKSLSDDDIKKRYVVIQGSEFKLGTKGPNGDEANSLTLRIDSGTNPKQIKLESEGGDLLGIYEFDKDTWKVAFGPARPRNYEPNVDTLVLVLKPGADAK